MFWESAGLYGVVVLQGVEVATVGGACVVPKVAGWWVSLGCWVFRVSLASQWGYQEHPSWWPGWSDEAGVGEVARYGLARWQGLQW